MRAVGMKTSHTQTRTIPLGADEAQIHLPASEPDLKEL